MGIERFFASLYNNYDITQDQPFPYKKISANHLFFDFNSIIHITSKRVLKNNSNFNLSFLNNLIVDKVCEYILNLLKNNFKANDIKFIMLAIDGVPSIAKMMEQKHRRYMGELINIIIEKE